MNCRFYWSVRGYDRDSTPQSVTGYAPSLDEALASVRQAQRWVMTACEPLNVFACIIIEDSPFVVHVDFAGGWYLQTRGEIDRKAREILNREEVAA